MTRDEIMKMEAGRELDALIHGKVMGVGRVNRRGTFWWQGQYGNGEPYWYIDAPKYSTDIAAAWEVVARMKERTRNLFMIEYAYNRTYATFENGADPDVEANGENCTPLAICRAALLAVMSTHETA